MPGGAHTPYSHHFAHYGVFSDPGTAAAMMGAMHATLAGGGGIIGKTSASVGISGEHHHMTNSGMGLGPEGCAEMVRGLMDSVDGVFTAVDFGAQQPRSLSSDSRKGSVPIRALAKTTSITGMDAGNGGGPVTTKRQQSLAWMPSSELGGGGAAGGGEGFSPPTSPVPMLLSSPLLAVPASVAMATRPPVANMASLLHHHGNGKPIKMETDGSTVMACREESHSAMEEDESVLEGGSSAMTSEEGMVGGLHLGNVHSHLLPRTCKMSDINEAGVAGVAGPIPPLPMATAWSAAVAMETTASPRNSVPELDVPSEAVLAGMVCVCSHSSFG